MSDGDTVCKQISFESFLSVWWSKNLNYSITYVKFVFLNIVLFLYTKTFNFITAN